LRRHPVPEKVYSSVGFEADFTDLRDAFKGELPNLLG
jgi:hypothetical protein